jgi:hypothetical protein
MIVAISVLFIGFALAALIYNQVGFEGRDEGATWFRMLMATSFMMPLLLLLLSICLMQIPGISKGSESNPVTEHAFNIVIYGGVVAMSWFGLVYLGVVTLFLGLAWTAPAKSRGQKILLWCYAAAFLWSVGIIAWWHFTGQTMKPA